MARVGGARVFFDVIGRFQAERLLAETQAGMMALQSVTEALMIDTMTGLQEAFMLVGDQMRALADSTVPVAQEVAKARIEFEKFARSIEDFEELDRTIRDLGQAYGFTADKALHAGAKTAQLSGILKSQQAIAAATEAGIQMAFIGGMETEAAMTRLIQLQQQTGYMYGGLTKEAYAQADAMTQARAVTEGTTKTLNQLNTIENRSAATMAQMTFVMNQFAASAVLAGDSISEMAAMSATLIEAGEEQGKAGRALRMVYARLGANTSDNNQILRHYIGTIRDAQGNMLPLMEIMKNLDSVWGDLTDQQRQGISQAVAGNDHYVRFLKLMENFDRVTQLNSQAMQELDKATEEVSLFTSDPAVMLDMTRARMEDLRGEIGDELIPVMNEMALAEEQMLQGLLNVVGALELGGDWKGKIAMLGKQMALISRYGFETYINMKNIVVAMRTQAVLQRALGGEQLARQKLAGASGASLSKDNVLLTERLLLQTEINLLQAELRVNEDAFGLAYAKKQELTKQQIVLEEELGQLKSQQLAYEQELATFLVSAQTAAEKNGKVRFSQLESEHNKMVLLKETELETFTIARTQAEQEIAIHERLMMTVQRRIDLATVLGNKITSEIAAKKYQQLQDEGYTDRAILNEIEYTEISLLSAEERKAAIIAEDAQNGIVSDFRTRRVKQRMLEMTMQAEKEVENAEVRKLALQGILGVEREQLLLTDSYIERHMARLAIDHQIVLTEEQIAIATNEYNIVLAELAKTITLVNAGEMEQEMLTIFLEGATRRLNVALKELLTDEQRLALELNKGAAAMGAQSEAAKVAAVRMQKISKSLSMFSLAATAATMGITIFGDKLGLDPEESATASIIAMSIAMVPAMVQMGAMTVEMLMSANAALTLSAAIWTTVAAVGALTLGVGLIAAFAAKSIVSKKKVDELNDSLDITNSLITDISQSGIENELISPDFYSAVLRRAGMDTLADMDLINASQGSLHAYETYLEGHIAHLETLNDDLTTTEGKMADEQLKILNKHLEAVQMKKDVLDAYGVLANDEQSMKQQEISVLKSLFKEKEAQFAEEQSFWDGETLSDAKQKELADIQNAISLLETGELADDWVVKSRGGGMIQTYLPSELRHDALAIIEEWKQATRDSAQVIVDGWEAQGNAVSDAAGTIITGIEDATTALDDFSSSQEEFFYGGDYELLKGDLVKQVINKGAENLLVNTEVNMTNNFHGLTIPEIVTRVADQILVELETRTGGYSSG